MNRQIVIVIPVYKNELSINEEISFKQCLKVLGLKYQMVLIAPKKLRLDSMIHMSNGKSQIMIEYFPTRCFSSLKSYNKLMLSIEFYERFKSYEYILIHQLDAYIFRDDLEFFVRQNLSYIGSPWLRMKNGKQFLVKNAGNGGLSLRKTQDFIGILNEGYIRKNMEYEIYLYQKFRHHGGVQTALSALGKMFNQVCTFEDIEKKFGIYEDVFWALLAPKMNTSFKVADAQFAQSFGFDSDPEYFYALNNNKIPFGCHGWSRPDLKSFWKRHINELKSDNGNKPNK